MTSPIIEHSTHRNLVAGWRAKGESLHLIEDPLNQQITYHRLKSPHDGHTIEVSFAELKDHPTKMRVSSTNWKCEDEPNGIYSKDDCRAFWRKLTDAGFVAF